MRSCLNPNLNLKCILTVLGIFVFVALVVSIWSVSFVEYKQKKVGEVIEKREGQQKNIDESERLRMLQLEKERNTNTRPLADSQKAKSKTTKQTKLIAEEMLTTITDVDWRKDLKKIEADNDINFALNNQRSGRKSIKAGKDYFLVGEVRDGVYKNKDLFMFYDSPMGGSGYTFFVFDDEEGGVLLSSRNIEVHEIDDLPSSIIAPNSSVVLERGWNRTRLFDDLEIDRKLFTDSFGRNYYQTEENCVVVKLPDHTALAYNVKVPFVDKRNGKNSINVYFDELKNSETYSYTKITGCGALCTPLNAVDLKRDELIYTGKTNSGDKVYELKDKNHKYLKDLYNDKNTLPYVGANAEKDGGSKYTYDEFLALRPLFFWKDSFGNWIRFMNNKFASAAEMCKPVIYLYPKTKQDLGIKVFPNGGFTHTEPKYGDGWKVSASPNGKITDLKTGKSYEYLFWEGIGVEIGKIEKGWVVGSDNLDSFLEDKLIKLGLNKKERHDFKEYWLARLSDKGFYKISFVEKSVFDKIAPLEIGPVKPDNVIRVFMLAQKTDEGTILEEQKLQESIDRDGFTVVEWGGALLK